MIFNYLIRLMLIFLNILNQNWFLKLFKNILLFGSECIYAYIKQKWVVSNSTG